MDPNATLARLRELTAGNDGPDADPAEVLAEVAELFTALDGWLARGGFPPLAWER